MVCGVTGLQRGNASRAKVDCKITKVSAATSCRAPMARAELHQTSGAVSSVTYCLHSRNFGKTKCQTKHLSVMRGEGPALALPWAMGHGGGEASPF